MDLLADLEARGLVHDTTDLAALKARLAQGAIGLYIGFDPTADSLHVGHLVGQLFMRRFQLAGHRPFPLAGGATGMIGDPGGRSEERNLLDVETLRHNVECIKAQLTKLLDFEPGPYQATLVNNADWTTGVTMLEFLRDVGKHFTVNQMTAKDSVRSRIESEHGISYTEFSYMLLQANDFRHLYEAHGVELQAGASDQWGNIVAGTELIRRRLGQQAFAITHPLMLKSDGSKFGKSAGGSVWLDPARTSPYQFRQFWMQCDDDMVGTYLKMLSLQPLDELDGPARRARRCAREAPCAALAGRRTHRARARRAGGTQRRPRSLGVVRWRPHRGHRRWCSQWHRRGSTRGRSAGRHRGAARARAAARRRRRQVGLRGQPTARPEGRSRGQSRARRRRSAAGLRRCSPVGSCSYGRASANSSSEKSRREVDAFGLPL